jgi:hypothetical protein
MRFLQSRRALAIAAVWAALLAWTGCGRDDGSQDDPGNAGLGGAGASGGGASGAGGAGNATAGGGAVGSGAGTGGTTANHGSGGNAGSGAGSGGAGGAAAGQGGAAAAQTAEDCSTHTETNHCLSVRGELNGSAFDFTCLVDTGGLRKDVTLNGTWSLGCTDPATGVEADVTIPHQEPGPFAYGVADNDGISVALELWKTSTLAVASSHLDALEITGDVQSEADASPRLTGTFEATWSAGSDPSCTPETCGTAHVAGSYRSVIDF